MKRILVPLALLAITPFAAAQKLEVVGDVEPQPLAANATRLAQAMEFLGTPLPKETADAVAAVAKEPDARKVQEALDPLVMVLVSINPESRVKVARGPAPAVLQQHGFTPVLVKVVNESTVKKGLKVTSPQAGPIFAGGASGNQTADKDRFLSVEMYGRPPMTDTLSGLKVEYAIALISSTESGKREATLGFDVGQGTQDQGFRGEVPVLFEVRPAVKVKLNVTDTDGTPTVGRFTFRDRAGRVYPPRAKRLAPDFFFQDQVYRADGTEVLLPPGELTMTFNRGPEYRQLERKILVADEAGPGSGMTVPVKLERWVNPRDYGFYSGDHHIHAAGCAHYTNPTEGVFAKDMFLHVKGEALNVGCNLTWGPCYEFQRQFFEPTINKLSEPFTVLKYDLEISGFGSQAMGHVCLLNLKEQTYPGSDGTKTRGWPMWTTPVMRWAKDQGGVTGYAHSASGLTLDNPGDKATAARGLIAMLDANKDGLLSADEAAKGVLPMKFEAMDTNADGQLSLEEIVAAADRVKNTLPNFALPPMNGIGAQEICVTTAMGVCDFISAMDTARVPEWNCWYHIMNCGFPLKASGETDFPCISGSRVGEGRVYVQLGKVDKVDFGDWCRGIAAGRTYVSDGYAHALEFRVGGQAPGDTLELEKPGPVAVSAKVAFASSLPLGTSKGGPLPKGTTRKVELIVNGEAVAAQDVPADDAVHEVTFSVPIAKSSWVALRQFPQMHTNPVTVKVAGQPIRASKKDAQWCLAVIDQLWRVRGPGLPPDERAAAEKTFDKARTIYRQIAEEAKE